MFILTLIRSGSDAFWVMVRARARARKNGRRGGSRGHRTSSILVIIL